LENLKLFKVIPPDVEYQFLYEILEKDIIKMEMPFEYYELYDPKSDHCYYKGANYMRLKKGDRKAWPAIENVIIEILWPDGSASTHKIESYRTDHFGWTDEYSGDAYGVTMCYPKVVITSRGGSITTDLSAISGIKARIVE
jgi:hypothetical protein